MLAVGMILGVYLLPQRENWFLNVQLVLNQERIYLQTGKNLGFYSE